MLSSLLKGVSGRNITSGVDSIDAWNVQDKNGNKIFYVDTVMTKFTVEKTKLS